MSRRAGRSVIVTNAGLQVIGRVSAHQAITGLVKGTHYAIEDSDRVFRSTSTTIAVPTVVAQAEYHKKARARRGLSRRAVLERDGYRCVYGRHCKGRGRGTTIDHIFPQSLGGEDRWENLAAACAECNAYKADSTLEELGWEYPITGPASQTDRDQAYVNNLVASLTTASVV